MRVMEDFTIQANESESPGVSACDDGVAEPQAQPAARKARRKAARPIALSIVNPLEPQIGIEAGIEPHRVIEALLFSSDLALSANRLVELVGAGTPSQVRAWVDQLNEQYDRAGLAFRVVEIARGYQLLTRAEYQPWLAKLNKHHSETRLSDATLETLAVVAYKQPIIRADIEAIRGVQCGEVLNRLREMGLVKIAGRAEVVGRPLLYGTTKRFLEVFGLADLSELPPMEALKLRAAPQAELAAVTPSVSPQVAAGA